MQQALKYKQANIAYWSKRAASYAEVHLQELTSAQKSIWSTFLAAQIRQHFPKRDNASIKVLEVGTGPGFLAIILAQAGFQVSAIDYTASMLECAKRNALAAKQIVPFAIMDAEHLTYESATFDIVISRNLTWNLLNPAQAYNEWYRVLKTGGLLLNFDANWYRYLYDPAAKEAHLQDRRNIAASTLVDDTAGTDVQAMEALALQSFLSKTERPEWDLDHLTALKMAVSVDESVWQKLWTATEYLNNASTPLFMLKAIKL